MTTHDAKPSHTRRQLLLAAVLVLVAIIVYIPAMAGGFVWDDDFLITRNTLIQDPAGIIKFWYTRDTPDYFPLTSSMFWLEWRLWGENPTGYHVVNILLHALTCVLLWRVLLGLSVPGAWAIALVFAVHPVNVASVAWISERKNTLAMVFYLAAILAYLWHERTTRSAGYVVALIAFAMALLSKTSVVVLPVVLLLLAWWQRGRLTRSDWLRTAPMFAMSLVLGLVTVVFQHQQQMLDPTRVFDSPALATRAAAAGAAVWFYLWKMLWPVNLMMVYPRWNVDAGSVIWWLPWMAMLALAYLCWSMRHRWGRGPAAALAYVFAALLPILGFITTSFMTFAWVADHWMHLALPGALALFVGGPAWFVHRHAQWRSLAVMTLCAIVIVCGVGTWRHAGMFRDEVTLWHRTLERNADAWVAHANLAVLLQRQGQLPAAIDHAQRAVSMRDDMPGNHRNYAYVLWRSGRYDEAIAQYERTLHVQPRYPQAVADLAMLLAERGRLAEAIERCRQSLVHLPDDPTVNYTLAAMLIRVGQPHEAEPHLHRVLAQQPAHADAHYNLGNLHLQRQQFSQAIEHYTAAIKVQPEHTQAYLNRGSAHARMQQQEKAISDYRQALVIDPTLAEAHNNLANALGRQGDAAAAIHHYEQAIKLRPDYLLARYNLAMALIDLGRAGEAREHLQQALVHARATGASQLAQTIEQQLAALERDMRIK